MLSRTCTQHLELVWRNVVPIAMVKGWSPYIRSSIQRDSSLLGLLAKLATPNLHDLHHHRLLPLPAMNKQNAILRSRKVACSCGMVVV